MKRLIITAILIAGTSVFALPPQAFQSQWVVANSDGGAEWSPTELTTMIAWFDADDLSTITTNGDGINDVTQWDDKSGNNYDVIQPENGASASRFNLEHSIQNNRSAMGLGSGLSDVMTNSTALFTNGNVSVFYVAALTNRAGWIIAQHPGAATVGRMLIDVSSVSPYNKTRFYFNNGATRETITTSVFADVTAHIGYAEHDPSIGRTAARIDGGSEEGVLTSQVWTPCATFFSIGRTSSTSVEGYIFEILITNPKLETADRQKVEGYLAWKWGIEDNLPADHPYKSSAPTL